VFKAALIVALYVLVPAGGMVAQELGLQDPTRPYRAAPAPSERTPAADRFELTAVLVSPQRRIAVINGKFYREGDAVNGAKITLIEPGFVRLQRGSEQREVRLIREGAGAQIRKGDSSS